MFAHMLLATAMSLTSQPLVTHTIRPVTHKLYKAPLVKVDPTYRKRLIIELCEIKPWFCDWMTS